MPRQGSTATRTTFAASWTGPTSSASAVILDVVYNHLGPDGNYLKAFTPAYFTDKYKTEWGQPINFDGPDSGPVRDYFASNAAYWIDEYHLDGLRLDATQNIYDDAPEPAKHILAEIGRRVRAAARGRSTIIVNENEPQLSGLVRPLDDGGFGLDALWNDDFHHAAMVALTGRNEAYYSDYLGRPQEFVSAVKYGYLYQGQWYSWQGKRRGQPGLDVPPAAFVLFLQNHDQIANSGRGLRAHQLTSPGRYRAMTALCSWPPARRCCSRARSSRPRPRSFTSPTTTRSWRSPSRPGDWSSCPSSHRSPIRS